MVTRSSASTSKFLGDTKERGFTGAKSGASGDTGAAEREDCQPVRPVLKSCPNYFRCVPWGNSFITSLSLPSPSTGQAQHLLPRAAARCQQAGLGSAPSGVGPLRDAPSLSPRSAQVDRVNHSFGIPTTRKSLLQAPGTRTGQQKGLTSQGAAIKGSEQGTNRTASACPVVHTRSPSRASQAIRKCE